MQHDCNDTKSCQNSFNDIGCKHLYKKLEVSRSSRKKDDIEETNAYAANVRIPSETPCLTDLKSTSPFQRINHIRPLPARRLSPVSLADVKSIPVKELVDLNTRNILKQCGWANRLPKEKA